MTDKKELIYQELKREIEVAAPESRLPSIRKLMARFETSQRMIETVAERLIADQLLYRQPGEGYFVRNISKSRKCHFRLLYPKWPSELFMKVEQTLCRLAEAGGNFEFSSRALESTEAFSANLPQDGCDALILMHPAGRITLELIQRLAALPIPVVLFDNEVGNVGFSCVSQDFYAGGARAAAHLIENGHRKLAVLVTEPHNTGIDMRIEGFREFATLSGAEVEVIETGLASWLPWKRVVYNTLTRHIEVHGVNFTGLFLVSAPCALEVYKVFAERGISIPADVSIVGHDMISTNEFMHPPLTAVEFDVIAAAKLLAEKLQTRLKGGAGTFQLRLKPELVVRESVRNLTMPVSNHNQSRVNLVGRIHS